MTTQATQTSTANSTESAETAAATESQTTETSAESTQAPVETDQSQTADSTFEKVAEADPATADTTADSSDDSESTDTDVTGAPETYQFNSPDENSPLDDGVVDAFSEVARELDMSQDAAQSVLDKVAPVIAKRQQESIAALHQEWVDDARNDSEFGGDNLKENLGVAQGVLNKFGGESLGSILADTGLNNHAEIIRVFYRIGKAMSEDSFVSGDRATASGPKTEQALAAAMYPNETH